MHVKSQSTNAKTDMQQIAVFLLLAFLLPLVCALILANASVPEALSLLLFGLEAATPSLAAILVVFLFSSRSGLRSWLRKCYIDQIDVRLILFGLLLPAVFIPVSKLLSLPITGIAPVPALLSPKKMLIVCWALVAEELGWRGFLQDRLQPYLSSRTLPLFLGLIWAAWHYHFYLANELPVPLFLFVLGCIADSYLYYACTKAAKGNIVPVSILHFSENLFLNIWLINPQNNNGSITPYLVYVALFALAAILAFVALERKQAQLHS